MCLNGTNPVETSEAPKQWQSCLGHYHPEEIVMEMMLFVQTQISKSFHTFSFLWTEALPKGKLQHFVTCCDLAVLYWLLSYCSCLKWVSLGKLRLQMELCYFRPSLCWTSQWIWNKWNKRNSAGPKDFSLTAVLQVSWKQFLHFLSCPCIIFLVK